MLRGEGLKWCGWRCFGEKLVIYVGLGVYIFSAFTRYGVYN